MQKYISRSVIVALRTLACLIVAFVCYKEARSHHAGLVLSHYLNGRAESCSLKESFESAAIADRQNHQVKALTAASRAVETAGAFSKWETPAGSYWVPTASSGSLLFNLAEQQRNIYSGPTGVRQGDVVLDCGANVGVFTRKALIAGAKTVVAIEPGPENIESLRRTFASEIAEGRVIVYPKGVWDREDVLRLNVDPNNSARDSFMGRPEGDHTVEAKLTTIDKLVEELKLPRVDFIKMDIEGAEPKALDGAKRTLTANHPRMALCIYHGKQDYVTIPRVVLATVPSYQYQKTCLCALDRVQPEVAFFF